MKITCEDIAWAAGLFEGEGCFHLQEKGLTAKATLSSTDEDVLLKYHRIVGIGAVGGPYQPTAKKENPHYKDFYTWTVWGIKDVRVVFELFKPWLCKRRTATFLEIDMKCTANRIYDPPSAGPRAKNIDRITAYEDLIKGRENIHEKA